MSFPLENIPHALSVVSSPDRLRYRGAHVNHPQLLTPVDLVAQGHGIRDHDLAQTTVVKSGDSVAAQNAVGNDGNDLLGAVGLDCGGCLAVERNDISIGAIVCYASSGTGTYAKVPQVSAMSSTRMATLSTTSPTSTILPTTLGRGRSLWISAKPRSRRSAIDVALSHISLFPSWPCLRLAHCDEPTSSHHRHRD